MGFEKCPRCKLVFQNPLPGPEEIEAIYGDDYFDYEIENHHAFFGLMLQSLKDVDFENITRDFDEKRVLDIGCATGLLLNHLRQQGWKPTGVEICSASAQYAREKFSLTVHEKPLEDVGFEANSFEIVHLSHLIEHVPDPRGLVEEIYRILVPGGYVVLTTPNHGGVTVRYYREKWRSLIAQHLHLFSKKNLKKLLADTGFEIKKQVSWGSIPVENNPNPRIKRLADRLAKKWNLGDVMLFLGRKGR
jgi:2-polyprenyl-3-methyl-5-hydroxy-6-metoxy-1,4-benzoquinol methylase